MDKDLKVFDTQKWQIRIVQTGQGLYVTSFWDKRKPILYQMRFTFESYELALAAALTLMFDKARGK